MIKHSVKFKRVKLNAHAYSIECFVEVPGFPPSTRDHLVGMISSAIRSETKKVREIVFEDQKTFKEKVRVIEENCRKIAGKVLSEKERVDELKRKIGLPVEEQKIEPRRKKPVTKKN
jgi:hypothetical protein